MQNTERKKDYYFSTINLVQQYLIDKSISIYNYVLPFIQFYIAYETLFRIESLAYKFLDLNSYHQYCYIINNLLKQIDEKYILEQKIFSSKLKLFALSKKYNKDLRYEVFLRNYYFIYSKYIIIDLKKYQYIIHWIILYIKENNLHLEGEDKMWLPKENYFYFCKIGNKTFFPKYYYFSGYDYLTIYGSVIKGRIVTFDIKLEIKEKEVLQFFISGNYIIKKNNNNINIYIYNNHLEKVFEQDYCIELEKKNKSYLINYRQKYLEAKSNYKKKESHQIWLINDRKDQAGDNGEYFFRYLQTIKPKDIQFYFIIEKNCSDYKRLENFENIIDFNSTKYLNLFLEADKIISSVSDSWVNNPFADDGKYITDLYHFDFVYLQNGVIKDDLSWYINRNLKHFDLLLTSSNKEYKSLLTFNYKYEKRNLLITGLPRFDNLIKLQKIIEKKKIILIFPTWRIYIKGVRDLVTLKTIKSERFTNTTYFNFYNKLINNQKLLEIMKNNDYLGIFCLHPNFAKQWEYFDENTIFTVKEKCNQQEILAESSLLITDFSSIFFDFGYMLKPTIFVQFDHEEYRNNQYPKGYFDYEKDGFGPICYGMQCTVKEIISYIENKCELKKIYFKRIKRFFKYFDESNCYRTYTGIKNGKNFYIINGYVLEINLYAIIFLTILKVIYLFYN